MADHDAVRRVLNRRGIDATSVFVRGLPKGTTDIWGKFKCFVLEGFTVVTSADFRLVARTKISEYFSRPC